MKKLIYLSALVMFFSCDKPDDLAPVSVAEMKNISYNENVALFDSRIKAVDPQHYIKELVFADFSGKGILGELVNFEGMAFVDNGQRFDATAGDGVFTAVEKTPYNEVVKAGSLTGSQPKSLLQAPIVGPTFKRMAELAAYQASHARNYVSSGSNAGARLAQLIICRAYWTINTCYASRWGLCDGACCVTISCVVE